MFKLFPIKATKFTWQEIKGTNRFIWILIWSALLLTFGFGLITPIFAVFLTQQIQGGTLVTFLLLFVFYQRVKKEVSSG